MTISKAVFCVSDFSFRMVQQQADPAEDEEAGTGGNAERTGVIWIGYRYWEMKQRTYHDKRW